MLYLRESANLLIPQLNPNLAIQCPVSRHYELGYLVDFCFQLKPDKTYEFHINFYNKITLKFRHWAKINSRYGPVNNGSDSHQLILQRGALGISPTSRPCQKNGCLKLLLTRWMWQGIP
jgi:hypothetical protein